MRNKGNPQRVSFSACFVLSGNKAFYFMLLKAYNAFLWNSVGVEGFQKMILVYFLEDVNM